MSAFESLSRTRLWLSTTRHLTLKQGYTRAKRILRRRWWSWTGGRVELPRQAPLAPHDPLWSPLVPAAGRPPSSAADLQPRLAAAQSVSCGQFRFLAQERYWPDEPDWHDPSVPQLWRYHLHYFEYVLDFALLAASGQRITAWNAFRRLGWSWMRRNEGLRGDGWHPYTVSRRVVNFCHALSVFVTELAADGPFSSDLARSTYAQLRYLHRNIEYDVRGNHIVENARALIHGGIVFQGEEPERWFEDGMQLLESEVAEQIEADGGHFERNPAYHAVVLQDLLEIAVFLQRNRAVPDWLNDAITRMLDFLAAITMPDGQLPLIKDTTLDGLPPHDLLAAGALYLGQSRWKRTGPSRVYAWCLFGDEGWKRLEQMEADDIRNSRRYFEASGFAILRDKRTFAVIDVGRPCPDYLPAHAHADLFSFELAVDGVRTIVDSGVYEYQEGVWRDFFRSTRAHNTVEVGGSNQIEVWSSFRVGRRTVPTNVHWCLSGHYSALQAEHGGYERLSVPVTHRRTFVATALGTFVVIDELFGEGTAACRSFLHAHPTLQIDGSHSAWRIGRVQVSPFGIESAVVQRGEQEPLQGWYSERFGMVTANEVLTMEHTGRLPFLFGYAIAFAPVSVEVSEERGAGFVRLRSESECVNVRLPRDGEPAIETS